MQPFLTKSHAIEGLRDLRSTALGGRNFGSLAVRLMEEKIAAEALSMLRSRQDGNHCLWRRAVALEILAARSWSIRITEELETAFANELPFDSGPSLAQLLRCDVAFAAFPTDVFSSDGDPPPWVLLALVRGLPKEAQDQAHTIQRWPDHDASFRDCKVFLQICSPVGKILRSVSDDSWTLAARLAQCALDDPPHRQSLAREWMITGHVNATGEIHRVHIGDKVRIHAERQWMIPPSNDSDVLGHALRLGVVRFPPSLDAAWTFVTGEGVRRVGNVNWADLTRPVLHTFTSAAWNPVMLAILQASPKAIKIWHSSSPISKQPAEAIHGALQPGRWWDLHNLLRPPSEVSSASLDEAERTIRPELERDLSSCAKVLFNITQGNRIMGLAPQRLAQRYGNLWLIYRDIDDAKDPHQFTVIRYEDLQPTMHKLVGPGHFVRDLPPEVVDRLTETQRHPAAISRERIAAALNAYVDLSGVPDDAWKALANPPKEPPVTSNDIVAALGGRAVGEKVKFPSEKSLA